MRTQIPELALFLVGALATAAIAGWLSVNQDRRWVAENASQTQISARAIEQALHHTAEDARILAQFFAASEQVEGDEFARFTRTILDNHPMLRALEWAPRVSNTDRAAFEASARAQGLADFAIRERRDGELVSAAERAEYFPVFRVEPLRGNEATVGFDLGSEPNRFAALTRACATGQATAAAAVRLVQQPGADSGLILLAPDYDPTARALPQAERCARVRGFALAVMDVNDLVANAVADLPYQNLDLAVFDAGVQNGNRLLALRPAKTRPLRVALDPASLIHDPAAAQYLFSFAGRSLAVAGLQALPPKPSPAPVLALLIGLVSSSMLAGSRRRTLRVLRASEERLRLATDAAEVGMWDWDLSSGLVLWSRQHERLWDFEPGEFDGTLDAIGSRVHPEDWPLVRASLDQCRGAGQGYDQEFRVLWPDGSQHWVRGRGEAVLDAAGRVVRMVGTAQEITATRAAQNALEAERTSLEQRVAERTADLQASEVKFRTIYDLLPIGLAITDPAGQLIACNQAARGLLGLKLGQTFECSYRDLNWPLLRPDGAPMPAEELASVRSMREHRPVRDVEMGVDGPDGITWLSVSAMPAQHADFGVVVAFVDMTAHKLAEEARRVSEARLDIIANSAQDGIIMLDDTGAVEFWNPAATRLFGYAADSVLGRNLHGFLAPPTARAGHQQAFARFQQTGQGAAVGKTLELNGLHADGHEVPLELSLSAVQVQGVWHSVGLVRDISERKRAECELQRLAERLQLATEAGGIGVWEWDLGSNALTWDARMYALYHLREEDFGGAYSAWVDGLHPGDLAATMAEMEKSLSGNSPFNAEFRVCWPDGQVRWIKAFGKSACDRDGTPLRMIGVNWDITEQKQTLAEVAASEARARAVIEASPVPQALAIDLGAVSYLNPAFTETFGYTIEDIPTWTDWRRQAMPDAAYRDEMVRQRQERLERAEREGKLFEPLEVEVLCKDGSQRTVMARITQLADGRQLNTVYDITDLKRAQQAAEEAALTKMRFLAQMSHEIRTPMNGILGLSELALQRGLDPTTRDYLEKLHQSGTNLLGILNDILDQAKIESEELTLEQAAFDCNALLESQRSLFAPIAQAKGLELDVDADPAVPYWLIGDQLRLRQVLSNLLNNAIKFTDHGKISLHIACRERTESECRLAVTVTDTGMGMDEVTRTRLFKPFSQGDDSIARRYGGTGLGLSISDRLIGLMGGHLAVESQPGSGSCFSFDLLLPIAAEPQSDASQQPGARVDLRGTRILVAEDQPINQRVISDMLRLLGGQVMVAENGREALDQLAAGSYALVLMDIQMPTMDGLAATRLIRANPAWADLPVIALTAGVTAAERKQMTTVGMNDLIPKPVTLDGLNAVLAHWLPHAVVPSAPADATESARSEARSEARPEVGSQADAQRAQPAGDLERLDLPGFDLHLLNQLFGAPEEIAELLRQFATSVRGDVDAIAAAWAMHDEAMARQLTHRLKGVACNVGASDLCAAAGRLEAALDAAGAKDKAELSALFDQLRAAHAATISQIDGLSEFADASTPAVVSPAEPLLRELDALLRDNRFVSAGLLDQLRAALPAHAVSLFSALRQAIDGFDYPSARVSLDRLTAALRDSDAV